LCHIHVNSGAIAARISEGKVSGGPRECIIQTARQLSDRLQKEIAW
jgi:hypothetical protein